ncbi:recombination mediator RecR [Thalassospira lucentensis]|uniref:recombination mediator RecR n=1 Tax=Thalassospira lucentensis TaxID=168935 RepID=UPI00142E49C4|nr:recombination mediator RecR [Thalassospira lucentensis]NIZ01029.1 recombination protein RecR [Thalassospira lucentensis]
MTGREIENLIKLLSRLPGLGPRSARRAVLQMLKKPEMLMIPLSDSLRATADAMTTCENCGNIDVTDPCHICADQTRTADIICVVEEVQDLWALERGASFKGQYHVLGGTLSPLDGIGPDDLKIDQLINRARNEAVTEVILATNATVDGQTTAHYITERLIETGVKVTRLAHGVPVGGELDYLDDGTLAAALRSRSSV